MIEVQNSVPHPRVDEAVLFPFDDHSIPFTAGLRLHLVSGKPPGVKTPIVLDKGAPGAPDDDRVRFYGNNTVGTATPGYAAWKALDCRHYALTINKTLYNGGQFSQVLLPGTLELSEDGQTLTISLKQHVFNQSGTEVATGTVTGSAKRANAGNGE